MKIGGNTFTGSSPGFHPGRVPLRCKDKRKEETEMFILSLLMHPAGLILVAMFVIGHVVTRALLGGD